MSTVPVPSVVAILLCDTLIEDARTSKKTLVGLFQNLVVARFPINAKLWLFGRMMDAKGKYVFRVVFVHLDDDMALHEFVTPELEAESMLGFVELALEMGLTVLKPGTYQFQLFANDVYIGRTVMEALKQGEKA